MTPFQAFVLGVVQGLTEFLPVSSSGHLVLVPFLAGWPAQSLTFDVMLHLGTLAATVGYFGRDFLRMGRSLFRSVTVHGLALRAFESDAKLLLLVAVSSIPAALAGVLLADVVEAQRAPGLVVVMLVAVAIVMLLAERAGRQSGGLHDIRLGRAVIIGLAQAVALVPGTSRSAITISAGLFGGLTREAATRFSFLMAVPIIAGAGAVRLLDLFESPPASDEVVPLVIGFATSFVVGLLAIRFMLRYLRNHSLMPFVIYRFMLAGLVIVTSVQAG